MSNKTKTTTPKPDGKTALTPKLRFSEFRDAEGWDTTPGDELFEQINNRQAPAGLPILAITQEHGAIPRDLIDYHVSVTDKSVETYKEVRPGDFIISLRSFQGGIEYSDYHGICSPAYVILRKRAELSDLFFKQHFKSHRFIQQLTKNLEGLRDGKMVSYKQFSELLLLNPSPPEQQKIAECLNSVDELITAQARKLDALKTHKKGLMQQLFPREGETQPRLRFPEFQNAGEWDGQPLKEVFSIFQGFAFSSNDSVDRGSRWLKIADVGIQRMNHDAPSFLPVDYKERFAKFSVRQGDYVIALTRPILSGQLKIAQVDNIFDGALLNQRVGKLITSHHPAFVFFLLQSWKLIGDIEKSISGNDPPNLSAQQIEGIKTYVPQLPEQQRIADCLTSLDDLIAAQTQKLEALKTHKKGLMQQLFPSPDTKQRH
ncbi:MAG: restriction endonuclease subunit S [Desulfobulbaceae bacterium]|nr:restriction endonuclease subunit S [Desulfobulbaceae bacterium]